MKGNHDVIKGSFTKYVETAVKRSRKDYINREQRREEISMEMETWDNSEEAKTDILAYSQEETDQILWEAEAVRQYMKDCVEREMWESISRLTDFEILIVFAKVFRQLTFAEIGRKMEKTPEKVASAYSYARKKIKRGRKTNGN